LPECRFLLIRHRTECEIFDLRYEMLTTWFDRTGCAAVRRSLKHSTGNCMRLGRSDETLRFGHVNPKVTPCHFVMVIYTDKVALIFRFEKLFV
jgi:hypothetical protein